MLVRLRVRRSTTAEWEADDPILLEGEVGYDTVERLFKVGDGVNHWTDLPFSVPEVTDGAIASLIETGTETNAALVATVAQLKVWARDPDLLVAGVITRDANGAATTAAVAWPDGEPGTYVADVLSATFPGAVDAYHITYGSPVDKTFTQPTVTRDGTGAVVDIPEIEVS